MIKSREMCGVPKTVRGAFYPAFLLVPAANTPFAPYKRGSAHDLYGPESDGTLRGPSFPRWSSLPSVSRPEREYTSGGPRTRVDRRRRRVSGGLPSPRGPTAGNDPSYRSVVVRSLDGEGGGGSGGGEVRAGNDGADAVGRGLKRRPFLARVPGRRRVVRRRARRVRVREKHGP